MVDHWPVSYTLSKDEAIMIQDYRREKEAMESEAKVFRTNGTVERYPEQSPNMKAVEIVNKLSDYFNCMPDAIESNIFTLASMSGMNKYQIAAAETAIYPGKGTFVGLMYVALKGAGESGEFAENVGKALRDDDICDDHSGSNMFEFGELSDKRRTKLKFELGDELWYVSQKAKELGFTLEEIAEANLEKLGNRAKNGTLKGSGDDR